MAWKWTAQREEAAALVAADDLTDQAIADKIGITKTTLERWKHVPEFQARVSDLVSALREEIRKRGISVVENRVGRQSRHWRDLQQIVSERQEAARLQLEAHRSVQAKLEPLFSELDDVERRIRLRQESLRIPNEIEEAHAAADVDRAKELRKQIELLEESDPGAPAPGQLTGHMVREVTYSKTGKRERWVPDTPLLTELRQLEEMAARELGQRVEKREMSGPEGGAISINLFGEALEKIYGGDAPNPNVEPGAS